MAGDVTIITRADAGRAFTAIWGRCETLRSLVAAWGKRLPWAGVNEWNYSNVTDTDRDDSRSLRTLIATTVTEGLLSAPDGRVGPLELAMWRQFLLYVPWLLFPPLGDKLISLLGINPDERRTRLGVSQEPIALDIDGLPAGISDIIKPTDANRAFHTIWTQMNSRAREKIAGWTAQEDCDNDAPGQALRTEIWGFFAVVTKPAPAGRLGPAELAMAQQFLLSLPWQLFPPLDDDAIRLYGITHAEREERLAVSGATPVGVAGSVRHLEQRAEGRRRRRINRRCPLCFVIFKGRPRSVSLPAQWMYLPEQPGQPGELECLLVPRVDSVPAALMAALPYVNEVVTTAGPFHSYDEYRGWVTAQQAEAESSSWLSRLGIDHAYGEDGTDD